MIIDCEDFQELAQKRREMGHHQWNGLCKSLINDDAVELSDRMGYRDMAAITLLHRQYGSWEKLQEALSAKYPSVDLAEFFAKYDKLDWCNDKNIRKIANRLSVNDLIIIMLWYDRWRFDRGGDRKVLNYSATVLALNQLVGCAVKAALTPVNGLPLNINTMPLDCVVAMLEEVSEPELASQRFCYMNIPKAADALKSEEGGSLAQSLLVLEALDIHPEEMTPERENASMALFPEYDSQLCTEKQIADWFSTLVEKQLACLGETGEVALILDTAWINNPVVHSLIDEYMDKGQIKCIFNIPVTGGDYWLTELRCIVFSGQIDHNKVRVIDFSDLLAGQASSLMTDGQPVLDLQEAISNRLQTDDDNVAWVDKEFFLEKGNAYDPYYCNSVLYLERLQREGKCVSLGQLAGKAALPDNLVGNGIVAPNMITMLRPVAVTQLRKIKKNSQVGQEDQQERGTTIYFVAPKHIRNGELLIREGLENATIGPAILEKVQRYSLKPGDLLISRIGAIDVALVTEEDIAGRILVAADSLHIIRCNPEIMDKQQLVMNTRFMYMYMRSKAGKRQLSNLAEDRSVNLLPMTKLLELKFTTDEAVIREVTTKWQQIQAAKQMIDGYIKETDSLLKL
ncbi:MAG: restriction endonuclease subunit S [Anaerovibrio sp.]|uniref:hypothetical protein n=1 Tax=Anaerovibrio sp. TaxID=1872532 RepID=UPI0025C29560|nr:hypothetical protein [Anaerovibrio sp.]MBE6100325.1 restriction endonuclease subunit S [Anaerovibrio sp.]